VRLGRKYGLGHAAAAMFEVRQETMHVARLSAEQAKGPYIVAALMPHQTPSRTRGFCMVAGELRPIARSLPCSLSELAIESKDDFVQSQGRGKFERSETYKCGRL
jgi:hypothetical protein